MKVMCIADNDWFYINHKRSLFLWLIPYVKKPKKSTGPKYGEICTIIQVYVSPLDAEDYYILKEHRHNPESGYNAKFFIPLSSISETEMERDYNKVTQ